MFYFVPAWYQRERQWYDTTPFWFRVYERMEFDDTINQLKMFQNAKEETCLFILNYQPQLRYFLHKQDLLKSTYWSFFDEIQNINLTETHMLNFKTLNWLEGTLFVYTPFAVAAKKDEEVYATIHFAENGNLHSIEYLKEGQLSYIYVFDDRGIVSSIIYYDVSGHIKHQDYLNPAGVWQVREDLSGQSRFLTINPKADKSFNQSHYDSWEDLITEKLTEFRVLQMTERDCLVIATHSQHNQLLLDSFVAQKKVLSFFEERTSALDDLELHQLLVEGQLFVTESEHKKQSLMDQLATINVERPVLKISPFDTRLRLGHSQNTKALIVYLFIDSMAQELLYEVLDLLLVEMDKNDLIQLELASYKYGERLEAAQAYVEQEIQAKFDLRKFYTFVEDDSENHIDDLTELELSRLSFNLIKNETQIINLLDQVRLIVDLGDVPDIFTQIAAISAGIPQINRVNTDYVVGHQNGLVINDISELPEALGFYFDGLANWNKALVYTVQKMAAYTSGRILKQWKELLFRSENG